MRKQTSSITPPRRKSMKEESFNLDDSPRGAENTSTRETKVTPPPTVTLPRPVTSSSLPTYKVLLVGDAGVGKSNLLLRFSNNAFDITTRSTIGVEFVSREVDIGGGEGEYSAHRTTEKVNVQIWDTAGQERCGLISSAFFRNARGVAVCYDVTRRQTLLNVPRWFAHAKQFADQNCVFAVIGNKTDLHNLREVTEDSAEEMAHILGVRHYYASARTGEGVPTAFFQVILAIHSMCKVQNIVTPLVASSQHVVSSPRVPASTKVQSPLRPSAPTFLGIGNGTKKDPGKCCS